MDVAEMIFIIFLAVVMWVGCGLVAYHSFLADMYAVIRDTAGEAGLANEHFERWRQTRRLPFIYVYFALTGPFSLIVVVIATRGFRTGFRT